MCFFLGVPNSKFGVRCYFTETKVKLFILWLFLYCGCCFILYCGCCFILYCGCCFIFRYKLSKYLSIGMITCGIVICTIISVNKPVNIYIYILIYMCVCIYMIFKLLLLLLRETDQKLVVK